MPPPPIPDSFRTSAATPPRSSTGVSADSEPVGGLEESTGSDSPTVSVVVPTYNRAVTLPAALESVFVQTHQPYELVVVDGGSSDGTEDVLAAVDDDRLSVICRDSPAGPSAARNTGIQETNGEYVAFLDADDRWHPHKLDRQLTALERSSASVALTGLSKSTGEPRTRDGANGDVHDAIRRLDVPTYTSTLVASRQALEDVGGFDESLPCFEDWELCLRLSKEYEFAFVDDSLVWKGTDGDNASADPDRLAEAIRSLDGQYDLPPSARGQFLADVGITHFEAGRFATGRSYIYRALQADPRRAKAAIALVLATADSPTLFDVGMGAVYQTERYLAHVREALRAQLDALLAGGGSRR